MVLDDPNYVALLYVEVLHKSFMRTLDAFSFI